MWIVFDTKKEGLQTLLKPWQEAALRFIWGRGGEPATSRDVWVHVARSTGISRASVINFLRRMAGEGVLNEEFQTCKGGTQGLYTPALDEEVFRLHVARTVISKLAEVFPEASREAMKKVLQG